MNPMTEQELKEPFAGFESFGVCVAKMQADGHDEESAKRICGSLKAKHEESLRPVSNLHEEGLPEY